MDDVEEYLQQFTSSNDKLSQNETINSNELQKIESNTLNSTEQQPPVISPKLNDEKPSADVACVGGELTGGVADVACGSELTDSGKVDGCVPLAVSDDVACVGSELTDGVADVACVGSELTDSVKPDGVADVACVGSELTDSVKPDGVADVASVGSELTDSVKPDGCVPLAVSDDVACGDTEVMDSVKVDGVECEKTGVDDVACGGSELMDSVEVDGVADVANGVECEKTGVADVACVGGELTDSVKVDGVECEKTGVADVACGGSEDKIIGESEPEAVKMGIEIVKGGEVVTEGQVDVDQGGEKEEQIVADKEEQIVDVACGGSELMDSVKVGGVADVADGVVCENTGVADVASVGSELTKECEDKIIGESEAEGVKGGEAVTEGQEDVVQGVEAELVKDDKRIVADKEELKTDDVEKQNDEEVVAVKTRERGRKRGESSSVKKCGRPKKSGRDGSKTTPKSSSVKMSDDDDEDFQAVGKKSTDLPIKRRGRPRKSEGSTAKATPKSMSVKMIKKEVVEAKSPDLPIKRRGRPRKSGGTSSKAAPESTSVKMINEDVEPVKTELPDPPVKKLGRPRKSEGTSSKAAPESTSVKMVEEDEDVVAVETELPDSPITKELGRPRKSEGSSQEATPKSASVKMISKEKEEEDVCFICFDGGELVLCDKRGCPKAYHHSCIDRDEAFFQAKGQWNCGWHLCSICAKKAEYMCYTCTYSLCKACTKTNVILCVREEEKKGFCEPCMRIVMLIENNSQETQEDVDFDDEDSWEYMFKEYWTDVKPKLNISLAELLEAKNAWKGSGPAGEQEPPAVHSDGSSGSEDPSENPESQTKKKRKRKSNKQKTIDSAVIAFEGTSVPESENTLLKKESESTEWATEELLEFVAHMGIKNKSYQSQFDVQALLLEYIKTNKLRDPRKKSQIICDARLTRLFGKPRVGHFEMLKLLESHFLIKEDFQMDKSVVDTEVGLVDDEDYETAKRDRKDKKRKIHKKADREPQSNREDFAAVDVHNINLIYLKRKFLEDLLNDAETFNSKVVGTFVRIRIQGANNKQDIYRLVQVTGTTKGEQYAVGKQMTDTMLEILNLDKTESVSIDIISNHDFTEDECKRLRQCMKCGLIKSPKVGDILDKAIEIQAVRVNDWLEAEVVRISHLRDRASDLGRKKELRECVEKLQLLKTPEERARRIQDIPVIHDDSTMDPNHESENDADESDKKQDLYQSSLSSNSSKGQDYPSKESWSSTGAGTSRSSVKNYELSRNLSDNKVEDVITAACFKPHNENLWDRGRDVVIQPPSILKKPSSTNETEKNMVPTEDVSETEELWHYRDPSGKIQGPFSMAKLRKWNNSKFFPVDLRIWKKSEKEGESVLLTDALEGRFYMANLPSPTPNRTIADSGLVVPSAVPGLYHGGNEGLQSPTPLGTSQNLSVGPYSGSGDQQPWPNMGSGNQSLNWGTASQGSWSVAAGSDNVRPDWVTSRGSSQGPRDSGNGNSKSAGPSGTSPTARNRGYKRSRFSEDKRDRRRSSGFRNDRRNRDRHRSFNSRRRSRDYDRY